MKFFKYVFAFTILAALFIGCSDITTKAKNTINKTGEKVGQTATEFIEGVTEGVEKSLQRKVELSDSLKAKGLSFGNTSVANDTVGSNNKLTVYFIFNKTFSDTLIAKVFNKENIEIGRSKLPVWGEKDDAKYFDFTFDERTYIEVKSKVIISN